VNRLLITGASGFLGGHITKLASDRFSTVGLFSTCPVSFEGTTTEAAALSQLNSVPPILNKFKPDIIVHNAALADPDRCEKQPQLTHRINVSATERIADWCRRQNARLIYISTDMVFDGEKGNYSENDQPHPLGVYAKSKAVAEQQALLSNPNTVVCRIALMYGRGIFRRPYSSEWLERELLRRVAQPDLAPLGLYDDQFRSMLSVKIAARIILELAESGFRGILHIGGAERISRFAFGEKLCRRLNLPMTFIQPISQIENPLQARRPRDVSLNLSLAQSVLKTPLLSVDAGLNEAFP